jgi:hypothetical protein
MDAVDGCGNSSSTTSQIITQVDTQAPVIGTAGVNATIEMYSDTDVHCTDSVRCM